MTTREATDLEFARSDGVPLHLDVFAPGGAGPHPLILWVCGGGWRTCSKNGAMSRAGWVLEEGYALAAVNYRVSSQAVWPAQLRDVEAGVRWLRAHAAEYDLDADRFGAWGDSAGGHLVAMLALAGGKGTEVRAACALFPPTDLLALASAPEEVGGLLGHPAAGDPECALAASPVSYARPDAPPLLLVHGDQDALVPLEQSIELRDILRKAGAEVDLMIIEGRGHDPDAFYADPAIRSRIRAFFAEHVGR